MAKTTVDKFAGRVPPAESGQAWLWDKLPTEQVDRLINREQLNDLVTEQGQKVLPRLIEVLRTSPVENSRESAAKSLALFGGEAAVTALEANIFYESPGEPELSDNPNRGPNYWVAPNAAGNALDSLGFLKDPKGKKNESLPLGIINPYKLEDYVSSIQVSGHNVHDIAARLANSIWDNIFNISDLRQEKAASTEPKDIGLIRVELKFNIDPDHLVAICEKRKLTVHRLADNIIQVKGSTWPGFKLTQPDLDLIFISNNKGGGSVISGNIPDTTLCLDLESVVRLLTRTAHWGSVGYLAKKKPVQPKQTQKTSGSLTDDDLFNFADQIDPRS